MIDIQRPQLLFILLPKATNIKTKLKNYKLSQEHVVKIEGWYEMPMGLYDIG